MGQDHEPIGFFSAGFPSRRIDSGIAHNQGATAFTSLHPWPTGHIGWNFANQSEFEARATVFLAEGLARQERLLFVSADPKPQLWPAKLLASGVLQIASVAEVYGAAAAVDATLQRKVFLDVLSAALGDGYSGIRVAADNTPMISTSEQTEAWIEWEKIADVLIAEHPITGLCGFDRSRCLPGRMLEVMGLHHTHAPSPPPRDPGQPQTRL